MKKYITLMVSAVVFAFTACTDSEDVKINYATNFKINPSTIIDGMTISGENFFPNSNQFPITVGQFLYNIDGELIKTNKVTLDNFYKEVEFLYSLSVGEYKVVTWACANTIDGNAPIWEAENTKDVEFLEFILSPVEEYYAGHNVLGVDVQDITVIDKPESVKINIPSVGSFVVFSFMHTDPMATRFEFGGNKESISYNPKNEKSTIDGNPDESTVWSMSNEINPSFEGTVRALFFLPMEKQTIIWNSFDNDYNIRKFNGFIFNPKKGENRSFTTDLLTGETNEVFDSEKSLKADNILYKPQQRYKVLTK